MTSTDITYCGYSKCPMTNCFRNQANIKNHNVLHSFAYFHDCDMYPKDEYPKDKNHEADT